MHLSAAFHSPSGDEYEVSLDTFDEEGLLSEEVKNTLQKDGIEIVEVTLDRKKGQERTDLKTLSAIAGVIANFLEQNENVILYFFCDDLHDVPNLSERHETKLLPQEYRSNLFSKMFDHHMNANRKSGITNLRINIGEGRFKAYIHFIARESHGLYVKKLVDDITEGYAK